MLPKMPYLPLRLPVLMEAACVTVSELAQRSGISERALRAMLGGRQKSMKINSAAMLCRELDIMIKDFIDYMCIEDAPAPATRGEMLGKKVGGAAGGGAEQQRA